MTGHGTAGTPRADLTMAQWRGIINASFAALDTHLARRACLPGGSPRRSWTMSTVDTATGLPRWPVGPGGEGCGEYLKRACSLGRGAAEPRTGGECAPRPGESWDSTWPTGQPARLRRPQHSMVMTFPRSAVRPIPAQLDTVTAQRMTQDEGLASGGVPMFATSRRLCRHGPHAENSCGRPGHAG
ncbi:hypothetical protein QJS66_13355 [Kocuria rhizophila]|nr:hypothetical protein QJS66_13355 [Kocuria rhizophila]